MQAKHRTLVHPKASFVSILEAAYDDRSDEKAWADDVIRVAARMFPRATGAGLHLVERVEGAHGVEVRHLAATGTAAVAQTLVDEAVRTVGGEALRHYFFPSQLVNTHSEIDHLSDPHVHEVVVDFRRRAGLADALGLIGQPEAGLSYIFYAPFSEKVSVERHEREILSRVALHLESAIRLRYRPESALAVLSPDGVVHHLTPGIPAADVLSRQVSIIESSRKKSARNDPESLAAWSALLAGKASLVERTIGGKRYYVLVDNAPARRGMRELSQREVGVVRMAARGLPSKLISYGLGLSPTSISQSLASAASKLGLSSRLQLVRLASNFVGEAPVAFDRKELTVVEREVLELIRQGLSNQEIAAARGRATRTVVNQVAAILRKTNTPSRRALVASSLPDD